MRTEKLINRIRDIIDYNAIVRTESGIIDYADNYNRLVSNLINLIFDLNEEKSEEERI